MDTRQPRLHIREATSGDLEVLAGFSVAMALESEDRRVDVGQVREGIRRLLDDPALGQVFVAWDDEAPIGMIMVGGREWSEWRNGLFFWSTGVYVEPAYRRGGLRSLLYRHLRTWCQNQPDVIGLRAYVSERNRMKPQHMNQTGYRIAEDLF